MIMSKNHILLVCCSLLLLALPAAARAQEDYLFTFDHDQHQFLVFPGSPCITCHLPDSPTVTPEPRACLQCHDEDFPELVRMPGMVNTHGPLWGFNHGPFAKNRQLDCAGCHQQNYCLDCHVQGPAQEMGKFGGALLNVHRSDFRVTHPIAARTNPRLCASCHEPASCSDCHSDFRRRTGHDGRAASPSHRRVFGLGVNGDLAAIHEDFRGENSLNRCDDCHRSGTVAPTMHAWSREHAREARRNLNTCQACHPSGDTCIQCHSAKSGPGGVNPHGPGWKNSSRAERLRSASGGATCVRCH
ncbi:cytochrome C [Desulfurivibrio sp. C05AmB]|uniref:cytochrome C n=1 Tax=Desulfurivibrio sp. C05AmB TaxID=3374371 RepID=UPI00376ED35D